MATTRKTPADARPADADQDVPAKDVDPRFELADNELGEKEGATHVVTLSDGRLVYTVNPAFTQYTDDDGVYDVVGVRNYTPPKGV